MVVPIPVESTDFDEIGVLDQLPFTGGFGANELVDVKDITVQELTQMRRKDGQARAIHRVLTLPLRQAPMTFMPNDGEGSDGDEEAQFVEDAFTQPLHMGGMSTSIGATFAQLGLALSDGFACLEKVWQVTPELDVTYRKFAPRASETIKFNLDENGGLESVRQRVHWQGEMRDVVIPAEKVLIYTAQMEENPWYGESYLLPAYYHYDKKHKLYYIAHLAAQFHAVPGRIGTFPSMASTDEKKKFRTQLAKMGFNTAMSKPENYTVEPFGGTTAMPDFEKLINHHDSMMAKSVLAHFIQLGTGSSTGSWALSSDQSDFFTIALETILKEWSEMFTFYAIPQLVDHNFRTRAYPAMNLGPLADSTREVMQDVFKEIATAGSVNVTKDFMFELEAKIADELGLEIDYEELEAEFEKEKEMERAAAEAALRALASNPIGGQEDDEEDDSEGSEGVVAASEVIRLADKISKEMKK
jgi:hypothetical protein